MGPDAVLGGRRGPGVQCAREDYQRSRIDADKIPLRSKPVVAMLALSLRNRPSTPASGAAQLLRQTRDEPSAGVGWLPGVLMRWLVGDFR